MEPQTQAEQWVKKHVHCIITDSNGIYIPQIFAERFIDETHPELSEKLADDFDILLDGPDHSEYWEAWSEIEQKWMGANGQHILQNSDLFLIDGKPPEGLDDQVSEILTQ